MARQKKYNETAQKYEQKLRKAGYSVKYNWTDPYGGYYEDVTVRGPIWRGYGGEFPTTRKAWEYIRRNY
jgi:hypothetical protein